MHGIITVLQRLLRQPLVILVASLCQKKSGIIALRHTILPVLQRIEQACIGKQQRFAKETVT